MWIHPRDLLFVAEYRCRQHGQCVPGLQKVIAVQIRGDPDRRVLEIYSGERDSFTGGRVHDTPFHLCSLGAGQGDGKDRQDDGYR